MQKTYHLVTYSVEEERLNRITHGLGFFASCAGWVLMVIAAAHTGDPYRIVSVSIFGACLTVFYAISTFYHSARTPQMRGLFRILDHASIYVVIAATYTPFVLVTLRGNGGWILFGVPIDAFESERVDWYSTDHGYCLSDASFICSLDK